MVGGVLQRHPKLRIAFSHGGGVFALVLPRLMQGWKLQKDLREKVRSPAEQARTLYYDTLVYDPATLAFLIERFGLTQLCLGTDHPFSIQETDPVGQVDALMLPHDDRALLFSGNARRFLGIDP